MSKRKIDLFGATSMVIANMVGTGVFTSLGFQLFEIHSGFSIIMIWIVGGILAMLGALCYAEVATYLSEDGGEYYFLSKIFHPALGYMAGFVSSTVGFAAPVAGASLALGAYIHGVWPTVPEKLLAALVVICISLIHANSLKWGMLFQKISTLTKVIIILLFVGFGFAMAPETHITFIPENFSSSVHEVWNKGWFTPAFSISLVWVSFAYSGWNASAYIAGSIKNPEKNLSRSILIGTAVVVLLYVLLNMVFLMSTNPDNLVGKKEVGLIAAESLFGGQIGKIMGGIISLLLVSTISSMIFTGPRVMASMFKDIGNLSFISRSKPDGTPSYAVYSQAILSLIMMFTMNFESLIYYVAFTLSLFTLLTVIGMMKLRIQMGKPKGYKAWGYPLTPVLFILMTSAVAFYFMQEKPLESLLGLTTALFGFGLYGLKEHPNRTN
jgi:APA family basic amino acid/polyamine antiporter